MTAPSSGIQTLQNKSRLKRERNISSPFPMTGNGSRYVQSLSREILLPWLPTLKWGWDGVDSGSTPSRGSGTLHAPEPCGLTTPSHLVLHPWLRLWPANSSAPRKDQLCKMFQANLLLFGWNVHQSSSTLIMHTNRRTVVLNACIVYVNILCVCI